MSTFLKEGIFFLRYSAAGLTAFGFELLLLNTLLLRFSNIPYYFIVAGAFAFVTIFQYEACHWWVFRSHERPMRMEYMYFVAILLSGLLLTVVLVSLFVNVFAISVVMARTISGLFVGLWDYYMNDRFNFRVHAFLRR